MLEDIRKLERIKDLGSEDSSGQSSSSDDEQEPWGEVNLVRDNILQRHADALVSEIGKRTRSPKVNNDTGGDYVVEVYDPLSANKDTTELSPQRSFELRGSEIATTEKVKQYNAPFVHSEFTEGAFFTNGHQLICLYPTAKIADHHILDEEVRETGSLLLNLNTLIL